MSDFGRAMEFVGKVAEAKLSATPEQMERLREEMPPVMDRFRNFQIGYDEIEAKLEEIMNG